MNQIVAGATSQILVQDLRAMAKGKWEVEVSFLDRVAKEKIRYAKNRLQALGFNMDEVLDGFLIASMVRKKCLGYE